MDAVGLELEVVSDDPVNVASGTGFQVSAGGGVRADGVD